MNGKKKKTYLGLETHMHLVPPFIVSVPLVLPSRSQLPLVLVVCWNGPAVGDRKNETRESEKSEIQIST